MRIPFTEFLLDHEEQIVVDPARPVEHERFVLQLDPGRTITTPGDRGTTCQRTTGRPVREALREQHPVELPRRVAESEQARGAIEKRDRLRYGAFFLAVFLVLVAPFLGAGIELPDVSLGNLIADAEDTVGTDLAYLILFPGLVLFLVVLCVNFVGDGLRDALDPKATR